MERSVRAFAPATVANLGVGFDWLGCAVGEKVPVILTALLVMVSLHHCMTCRVPPSKAAAAQWLLAWMEPVRHYMPAFPP